MNKNALFQNAFKNFQSVNGTVNTDERGFFSCMTMINMRLTLIVIFQT